MFQQPSRCPLVVWLTLSRRTWWRVRRIYQQTFWERRWITAMATLYLQKVYAGRQCCPVWCSPVPMLEVCTCGEVTCRGEPNPRQKPICQHIFPTPQSHRAYTCVRVEIRFCLRRLESQLLFELHESWAARGSGSAVFTMVQMVELELCPRT